MSSRAGAIRAGRAFVEAYLDSTQLEKGLGRAKDKLNSFSRQVRAIGGSLAGIGTAIVAPMALAIKSFSAAGDQLDKMSKRSGFAVETLSALDFAASQSGASIEQLDKALAAMARFSVMANRGLATATDLLDELGLSVEDVTKGSAEEKFLKIAQKISEVEDPTLKAGMALQVFGRQGRELLPMLQGGERGIAALMERAKELGIIMSKEDAEAAAEMTDSLDELSRSVKFLIFTVARELIPEAMDFSRFMTDTIPQIREWLGENKEMIVNVAKLGASLAAAGGGMIALAAATSTMATAAGTASAAVKLLTANIAMLKKTAAAAFAIAGILLVARHIYTTNDAVQELSRSLKNTIKLDKELASRRSGKNSQVLEKANRLEGPAKGEFLNSELEKAQKNLSRMRDSLVGQKKLVEQLTPTWLSLWQAGRGAYKVEKQELDAINARIKQQEKFIKELTQAKQQHQKEIQEKSSRTIEEVTSINGILSRLNEELETFGLDAGEKAIRELKKLNANEKELATARQKLAELSAKQAEEEARKAQEEKLKRAQEKADEAAKSIADMLNNLANEVSDLKLPKSQRGMQPGIRRLESLGATPEQIERFKTLYKEMQRLRNEDGQKNNQKSISSQGGTFSSLSSLMFGRVKEKEITEGDKLVAKGINQVKKVIEESGGLT